VTVFTPSAARAVADPHRVRDLAIAGVAVLVAIAVLYAVFLDQGALLAPLLGKLSYTANYLHEFVHDGRHLLAAPCH
jgi:Probable cobalt transporter subunit (CbtB)